MLEEAQLKALVELVVEFTLLPEQPGYIVDAMFAQAPALKVCRFSFFFRYLWFSDFKCDLFAIVMGDDRQAARRSSGTWTRAI